MHLNQKEEFTGDISTVRGFKFHLRLQGATSVLE